jgi:hypothetical protein
MPMKHILMIVGHLLIIRMIIIQHVVLADVLNSVEIVERIVWAVIVLMIVVEQQIVVEQIPSPDEKMLFHIEQE